MKRSTVHVYISLEVDDAFPDEAMSLIELKLQEALGDKPHLAIAHKISSSRPDAATVGVVAAFELGALTPIGRALAGEIR